MHCSGEMAAADFSLLDSLLRSVGITDAPKQPVITEPRKFLLVSTHAQQTTGYSKVSYNLIQQLATVQGLELHHFGFQKFFEIGAQYRPYPAGVTVYDPAAAEATGAPKEQGFGYSQLPEMIRSVQPQVVMIYNDAAVICAFLEKLVAAFPRPEDRCFKLLIYFDQVYTLQRPDLLARIEKEADAYFAFTEYWRRCLQEQGLKKPIHLLRHGFDAETYKPLERLALRRKHNIAENLFLMVNINRNTPRKRYDLVVTAFAELVARYPQKPIALLCVCDAGEQGGFPIYEIFTRELIKRGVSVEQNLGKLLITKTALNYTDETVNELYCMADCGVTAAEGEGFGLCQFEAMGCGVPQVVPDVGGFKDFCRPGNAVLVKPERAYYIPYSYSSLGGIAEVVNPADLCLGMEEYLLDSELRDAHGQAARATVLQYSWAEEVKELVQVVLGI
jgi:glycosyltransferase involved in cell wall biosynthesis